MKTFKILSAVLILSIAISACNSNSNNKTLGNTQDTSSVAGVHTTNDSAGVKTVPDSTKSEKSKGNADPSGQMKKTNAQKNQ